MNLAPADLPKDPGRFDLPIALGILAASGQIDGSRLAGYEFAGEHSLSGDKEVKKAVEVLGDPAEYARITREQDTKRK